MLHYMKLNPEPFEKIKSGKKTVELRLYDEKRRQLHIGDEICFTNLADKTETLLTEVVELFVFDSFEKLYKTIPLEMCGYSKEEALVADPHDMDAYYSAEEQKEYGVVGIELKVVDPLRNLNKNHKRNIMVSCCSEHAYEMKTCTMCGKRNEYIYSGGKSSYYRGYKLFHLDFRHFDLPNTVFTWIEVCPDCGYIAERIDSKEVLGLFGMKKMLAMAGWSRIGVPLKEEEITPTDKIPPKELVSEWILCDDYLNCDGLIFNDELSEVFYKYYILNIKAENKEGAFWALRCAAWNCEEYNDEQNAIICRDKIVTLLDDLIHNTPAPTELRLEPPITDTKAWEDIDSQYNDDWYWKCDKAELFLLIKIEMMRKNKRYDEVISEYKNKRCDAKFLQIILDFQLEKCRIQDDSMYTFEDIEELKNIYKKTT